MLFLVNIVSGLNMSEKETNEKTHKNDSTIWILYALSIIALVLLVFNQFAISGVNAKLSGNTAANIVTGKAISTADMAGIIPTGVPEIYGEELGISFDDISPNDPALADTTISKLGTYDTSIDLSALTNEEKQRYIAIASAISCEYCCGADSIIFANGQAACGCAHSYAMRGLAKYLLTKHPDMTNDQVLEELGKWKVLFFPGIHEQKAQVLASKGIELNYINLASNKYRGIETGATTSSGSMVGGC